MPRPTPSLCRLARALLAGTGSLTATLLAPAAEPAPASASALAPAWHAASLGLADDAFELFRDASGPEARLGEALALLIRQPKTDANLAAAATLLASLVAPDVPAPIARSARYHLARIEHVHRTRPDLAAARTHYARLIADHPGAPLAERAVVKLALLEVYAPGLDAASTRRAVFDAYVERLPGLRTASARRDLALVLADAAQRFAYSDPLALELLLTADAAGLARRQEQANVWVRIGELARDHGRVDLARTYYARFLATFLRDNRRLTIEERLAALPAAAPASAAPASLAP